MYETNCMVDRQFLLSPLLLLTFGLLINLLYSYYTLLYIVLELESNNTIAQEFISTIEERIQLGWHQHYFIAILTSSCFACFHVEQMKN